MAAARSPAARPAALLAAALIAITLLWSGLAGLAPHVTGPAAGRLEAPAGPGSPLVPARLVAIISPIAAAVPTEQRGRTDVPGGGQAAAMPPELQGDDALYCAHIPELALGAALHRAFTPRCARGPPA